MNRKVRASERNSARVARSGWKINRPPPREPHLAEPDDEVFLDLPGHPRLLRPGETGRVE